MIEHAEPAVAVQEDSSRAPCATVLSGPLFSKRCANVLRQFADNPGLVSGKYDRNTGERILFHGVADILGTVDFYLGAVDFYPPQTGLR